MGPRRPRRSRSSRRRRRSWRTAELGIARRQRHQLQQQRASSSNNCCSNRCSNSKAPCIVCRQSTLYCADTAHSISWCSRSTLCIVCRHGTLYFLVLTQHFRAMHFRKQAPLRVNVTWGGACMCSSVFQYSGVVVLRSPRSTPTLWEYSYLTLSLEAHALLVLSL